MTIKAVQRWVSAACVVSYLMLDLFKHTRLKCSSESRKETSEGEKKQLWVDLKSSFYRTGAVAQRASKPTREGCIRKDTRRDALW